MNTVDFRNKRITIMGLGLLGGAVNDALYLAKHGAKLVITDLKSAEELAPSIEKLTAYENQITYVLGEHRLEDFRDVDLVLQPGNVPESSPFLAEARTHNVPVHVSESLFLDHAPDVFVVGVTGTRGKTMTTQAVFYVLQKFPPEGKQVFLAGNTQGVSTLALLDEVQAGDVVVAELDSWALHALGEVKKSPHLSVFTTFMPDHMDFYKGDLDRYLSDKTNIFRYQSAKDTLVLGEQVVSILEKFVGMSSIPSTVHVASPEDVSEEWQLQVVGEHNRYNIACAAEALRKMGLAESDIKTGLESFPGVPGRLELRGEKGGVKVYNDTTATTPEAALAGLRAVASGKNVVHILGGSDKGLATDALVGEIDTYAKHVVLLPGTGTDKLVPFLVGKDVELHKPKDLAEAVEQAFAVAESGDVVLFSPGFASFGMFKNEYDRGEQFNTLI